MIGEPTLLTGAKMEPTEPKRVFRLARQTWGVVSTSSQSLVGAVILLIVALAALLAPLLAPYGPNEADFTQTLQPPSLSHPFGTDDLGRDQLSRILFGARIAVTAGLVPVGIACTIGVALGLIAGIAGGRIDKVIVAFLDAILAFPDLVLIISVTAALGPNLRNALLAIAFTTFPTFARVVRAQVMTMNQQEFVTAARAIGVRNSRLIVRHVLPNVIAPTIVIASLGVGGAILAEAALSYLGLGVQAPTASWGQMVNSGSRLLRLAPWMAIVPGVAIFVTVLATNFLGDGIRDALDPRLKGSR